MNMDLQEWEILPDDGFLEIHDDGGKKIFSRKYGNTDNDKSVFKSNYFICPSSSSSNNSSKLLGPAPEMNPRVPCQIIPVPIQLEPEIAGHRPEVEIPQIKAMAGEQEDTVSQVFFKKMKENEFVDMKMDSPTSMESGKNCSLVVKVDSEMMSGEGGEGEEEEEEEGMMNWEEEDNNGGVKMWRWWLSGIGAICSFGIAATTICIVILGSKQNHHHHHHHQQQQRKKLKFQIFSHDKRMNQVVHHATTLNEAISAVRGVPLTRAHITFGGYYEAH